MASVSAIEIKVGNLIRYRNSIFRVVKTEHVKPGKGGAFIQAELKDIKFGTKLNERFRSDQTLDKVLAESKVVQFLYKSGDNLECMDMDSYEQISVASSTLSGLPEFLVDNMQLTIEYADGEVVSTNLPDKVVCRISETQPYIKGQTVTSSFKPATLENGIVVKVPEFITSGEEIVVNTSSLEYIERAKK